MKTEKTKILDLVVTHHWFDLMESGIKKKEYRRNCEHWRKRLIVPKHEQVPIMFLWQHSFGFREYDIVRLRRGYTKTTADFEWLGTSWQNEDIAISEPFELRMAGPLFVIELGKRIEKET